MSDTFDYARDEYPDKYSPAAVYDPSNKLFSSPIQVAYFCYQKSDSPYIFIEFTSSFNRIDYKINEEYSYREELFDIMGNKICAFDTKCDYEFDNEDTHSPVIEDKYNDVPANYLKTPLKVKNYTRSPLQDITPSMTQKKKKNLNKLLVSVSEKHRFLTPRTMEKDGLGTDSGLRKMGRI